MHTAFPMTSGATITQTGHSGRLRSCSIQNIMTIDKGSTVMQSSNPPTRSYSVISSSEVKKTPGIYQTWLKVVEAKRAAVHRRKRADDVMLGAKALPLRNSK